MDFDNESLFHIAPRYAQANRLQYENNKNSNKQKLSISREPPSLLDNIEFISLCDRVTDLIE